MLIQKASGNTIRVGYTAMKTLLTREWKALVQYKINCEKGQVKLKAIATAFYYIRPELLEDRKV